MNLTRKTSLLLVAPLLFAFSSRNDEIGFGPAEGLSLTKSFESSQEVSLEEMSILMNGEEQDASEIGMEQTVARKSTVVISDEYLRIAGERPARLKRTFDDLAETLSVATSHAMMGDMDFDLEGESPLEGLSVVFTWSDEEGDFVADFAEGSEDDEALLERLTEDTDMRGFLPEDEVAEGDTWEVSPEAMRSILAFGGDLKIELDTSEIEEMAGGMGPGGGGSGALPPPDQFLGEIEGAVTATYAGNDEDGYARILLTVEVDSAKEITDFFSEALEQLPEEMDVQFDSADMEFELEGEATLLWDARAGHLHSFELNAETTLTMDMAMSMNMGGMGDMEFEMSMVLGGDWETKLSVSGGDE